MTDAETLREAKALILTEAHWCRSGFAQDSAGNLKDPTDPYARKWCAAGAVLHVTRTDCDEADRAGRILDYLARAAYPDYLCTDVDELIDCVATVNDDPKGFKNVHAMYDKAIAIAEAVE